VDAPATRVRSDAAAIVAAIDQTPLDQTPLLEHTPLLEQAPVGEQALTDAQRAILEFERTWWKRPGAKEQAIRDHFEISPTRYYQALNALLELPQALTYDAALVNRLQRLRSSALRTRGLP
jgi:uncharacterized protein DUF3263